jgi:hypothetical protein
VAKMASDAVTPKLISMFLAFITATSLYGDQSVSFARVYDCGIDGSALGRPLELPLRWPGASLFSAATLRLYDLRSPCPV